MDSYSWDLGPTANSDPWKNHRHSVKLTASDVVDLLADGRLEVQSEVGYWKDGNEIKELPHKHAVTLICHRGEAPVTR
jgi:hypothetical protein